MKKKLVAALMSAVMVAGLLAGCGSSTGSDTTADTAQESTTETTQETSEDTISGGAETEGDTTTASGDAITFWYMGDSTSGIDPLIEEFTADTGIQVNVQSIPWQNLSEKLLTAIASQSGPDVMQTTVSRTAELVTADAIIDMTGYVDGVEGFSKDRFFDASYESLKMNDKYYGVPWITDVYCNVYRTDIFAEAGWDTYPTTWDELKQACKDIKEKTGITPFMIGAANNYNELFNYPFRAGSAAVTEDRQAVFNQKEYVEAMEYLNSFYEEGLADRVWDGVANYVKLTNGEIAAYFGGTWEASQMAANSEMDGKWAVAQWPAGPANNNSVYAGSNLVIPTWTTNEDAVVKLIEFLTRTENMLKYNELSGSLPAVRDVW